MVQLNKIISPPSHIWEQVSPELTRRCTLVEFWGGSDTGRSTLASTAPGPMAYIHGYEKVDGILEKIKREGKDVRVCKFGGALKGKTEEVQKLAQVEADKMEQAILDAYSWARTIVLDTHIEAWRIIQLARIGTLTQAERSDKDTRLGQLIYAEINNRWMNLFKLFRVQAEENNRTNFIIIGGEKEEYKKVAGGTRAQATGKMVRGGQKDVYSQCDLVIKTTQKNGEFSAVIEKPWYNNDVRGVEIPSELLNFPEIMSLVTETDVGEWS